VYLLSTQQVLAMPVLKPGHIPCVRLHMTAPTSAAEHTRTPSLWLDAAGQEYMPEAITGLPTQGMAMLSGCRTNHREHNREYTGSLSDCCCCVGAKVKPDELLCSVGNLEGMDCMA
jgi:hypothetical protein